MLSVAISAQARRGFPLWRSLDMPPLDYKAEDLYARGRIVDSFCVTGFAVETERQSDPWCVCLRSPTDSAFVASATTRT